MKTELKNLLFMDSLAWLLLQLHVVMMTQLPLYLERTRALMLVLRTLRLAKMVVLGTLHLAKMLAQTPVKTPVLRSTHKFPPATAAEMTDWLAEEFHKQWDCSPTVIAQAMPHGAVSTVCSNAVIMVASSTTATPPWPIGSASVKEAFTDDTRTSTAGVFAYVKTSSSSWFWYANGSEVDAPNCVSCHAVDNEVIFQAERTQTPPTDAQELEAWITAGSYATDWLCESEASEPRGDSPHGPNRICVNNVVSTSTSTEDSDWNIGAATIKELYTTVSDAAPFGHLVSLKANVDSEDGANWFWYAPNGNGFGLDGCIGCHDGTTDTSSVSRDYIRLPLYR